MTRVGDQRREGSADGRLLYITSLHPDDIGEEFFEPEMRELRVRTNVVHVPVRPVSNATTPGLWTAPLLGASILGTALRVAVRKPYRTVKAVRSVIDAQRPGKTVRNLLCVPKGLWLSTQLHEGDAMIAAWATTPATVALVASTLSGVPWAMCVHRRDILEGVPLARKVRHAAFVRAISNASAEALRGQGCIPRQTATIHLGIDIPARATTQPYAAGLEVLCIANLIPLKNHHTLLRALRSDHVSGARLTLAGTGPERAALERLAAQLGVAAQVSFLGHLPHDELLTRMEDGEWNIVTLASLTEGIPVSLMEALGRGLPVVAANVGGVSELVAPAGGTLIDDPEDADAFASAWARVAREWDSAAADRARAIVAAEFSSSAAADRLLDLLRETVGYA